MTVDNWARSGLAELTGLPDGRPDMSRARVLEKAEAQVSEFRSLSAPRVAASRRAQLASLEASELLSGRAALLGLRRHGRISAGGAARLIRAADGLFAMSLARDDDVALVPALLSSTDVCDDYWGAIEAFARTSPAEEFVARARMLGLPAALVGETSPQQPVVTPRGTAVPPAAFDSLLVADLSSLWAGPLCGRLLAAAGATVVKVESSARPDGTRRGNREFFDWMNGEKISFCVDFDRERGIVARLLQAADVVIEASRPRALRRQGLAAEQLRPRPGQVWLRITAHGSHGEEAEWIGFGDDAAVAGGLIAYPPGGPVFCGDAIADPLTGIAAARAVVRSLEAGGGVHIDAALSQVAADYAAAGLVPTQGSAPPAQAPRPPRVLASGPEPGADNAEVARLLAVREARESAGCTLRWE